MTGGGLKTYEAVAQCSACGRTDRVSYDSPSQRVEEAMPGWLLPHGPSWLIRDGMGWSATICPDCMGRPIRDVLSQITDQWQGQPH